jgi:hypothetical protein
MTEQAPAIVAAMVFLMIAMTIGMTAAMIVGAFMLIWDAWKKHKRDQGEDGEGGDGGGGGWTDKPSGTPPGGGGPDRDLDRQFHAIADAIGKTIKIGEKDEEKVLT